MFFATFFFWLCAFLVCWTFALYPLVIIFLSRIWPHPCLSGEFAGKVSLIIAAHNEENVIREKIENCLKLDFGHVDSEIIIVSDGSTDKTNLILSEAKEADSRLKIFTYKPRAGKANALNVGFHESSGEILIFSDANVMIETDGPRKLLAPFCDNKVGAVCGKVTVSCRGETEIGGEGIYMRIEGLIQKAESLFWTMIGIDGALFAMRRELFRPLGGNVILDDFALSMEAPLAGQRIFYAKDAKADEDVIASTADEFKRKARIIAGGFQYLSWVIKNGGKMNVKAWFSFISHKILRWLAPIFMIGALLANIFLLGIFLYKAIFALQVLIYSLAVICHFIPSLRNQHIFYIPYYFCVMNAASFVGFYRFLFNRQDILWSKVSR